MVLCSFEGSSLQLSMACRLQSQSHMEVTTSRGRTVHLVLSAHKLHLAQSYECIKDELWLACITFRLCTFALYICTVHLHCTFALSSN